MWGISGVAEGMSVGCNARCRIETHTRPAQGTCISPRITSAETVSSNPTGGTDVCLLWMLYVVRGLCGELIARPEESYRLLFVVECDLETSWMRTRGPTGGRSHQKHTKYLTSNAVLTTSHNVCATWFCATYFIYRIFSNLIKIKVNQYHYRPGQAQKFPGS